jgi:hypothetical protein
MAGINLTGDRRSQLLEMLLAQQNQPRRRPILSGGELAARLGAQLIRQQQLKELQEQEAGAAKTTRANESAVMQKLLGGGDVDFQGRPIVDEQGNQQDRISLIQAMSQLPSDNPTRGAIAENLINEAFAEPAPPETQIIETKIDGEVVKQLVDKNTGQVIRELGRAPRTKPPSTTVNINQPELEREADKALGKTVGERAAKRFDAADASFADDANLNRMMLAIDRGAQTGFGEETILNIKSLGSTLFGIEFSEKDTEAEVIRKLGNEMALRLRNPSSGLGLTGSTSNKDLDFLVASVAGLQKSEGGNIKIINFAKRLNTMKRAIATEQSRIIGENKGRVPGDLDRQIMKFVNDYEFLTKEERKELEVISAENKSVVERFIPTEDDEATLEEILAR